MTISENKIDFIDTFFGDSVEYPLGRHGLPDNILPFGEYWIYVSSTFVSGFLNSGKIISACVLSRYTKNTEKFDEIYSVNMRPPQISTEPPTMKEVTRNHSSKQDVIRDFINGYRTYHMNLSMFRDDVLLLLRISEEPNYMFVWLDNDVSDCCIGRFHSKNYTEQEIIQSFVSYANKYSQETNQEDAVILDVQWMQGWLTF